MYVVEIYFLLRVLLLLFVRSMCSCAWGVLGVQENREVCDVPFDEEKSEGRIKTN